MAEMPTDIVSQRTAGLLNSGDCSTWEATRAKASEFGTRKQHQRQVPLGPGMLLAVVGPRIGVHRVDVIVAV